MFKKIICAALLLSSSIVAHAVPQTWSFTYSGFFHQEEGVFKSNLKLRGVFSGEDLNHDGVLVQSELFSLKIGNTDFISCGSNSNEYYQCSASDFSYQTGGPLNFAVTEGGHDPEGYVGGSHSIIAGSADSSYEYHGTQNTTKDLRWTAQTTLVVTQVPEPEAYAMFGLGLLGLLGLQRRRRA